MSWPVSRLGEVISFIRGVTFKPDDQVEPFSVGSTVVMRTKNVQMAGLDQSDLIAVPSGFVRRKEQSLLEGDILISSANSWDLVGKASYVPKLAYEATAGGFISIVRAKESVVDSRYLYHWVACPATQHKIRHCGRQTTNISNLDVDRFRDLEIPLPPLPEQKRIAAILDKADAIRRKRQQAIQLADDFLRSVFLDMFGDPVTNPKGLDITSIGKLCDVATGATPPRGGDEYYGGDIPWVKTGEVDGYVIYKTEENITSKALSISNCKLNPVGSIVMAMYGQGKTRGKVGVLGVEAATNQACAVIKPSSKIMMEYLYFYLKISYEALRSLGQGAGQPNLNLSIVKGFPVLLPSEVDQMRFLKVSESVGNFSKRSLSAIQDSSEFFKALSQKAFSGEL